MCMYVKDVPATKRDGLILECKKALSPHYISSWDAAALYYSSTYPNTRAGFKTPYFNTVIPNDGWLFPEKDWLTRSYQFIEDEKISGGILHAVTGGRRYGIRPAYTAFAFDVKAYGLRGSKNHQEFVCNALYIPCCDTKRKRRKETVDTIRELIGRPHLVARSILAKFPRLKGKVYG